MSWVTSEVGSSRPISESPRDLSRPLTRVGDARGSSGKRVLHLVGPDELLQKSSNAHATDHLPLGLVRSLRGEK